MSKASSVAGLMPHSNVKKSEKHIKTKSQFISAISNLEYPFQGTHEQQEAFNEGVSAVIDLLEACSCFKED